MIDLNKHPSNYGFLEHVIAYYAHKRDFESARFFRFFSTVKR